MGVCVPRVYSRQGGGPWEWRAGTLNNRLRRLPPTFPPITWNVHDASFTASSRTMFVNHGITVIDTL